MESNALHFIDLAPTPLICMTPVLPLAWQKTSHQFSLVTRLQHFTTWIREIEMCICFSSCFG